MKNIFICTGLLYRVLLGFGCRRKALALELKSNPQKYKLYRQTMSELRGLQEAPFNRIKIKDTRNYCLEYVMFDYGQWRCSLHNIKQLAYSNYDLWINRPQISVKINPLKFC